MKRKKFNPYKMFRGVLIPYGLLEMPINNAAKLLWGVLNSHCGKKGVVYPSQELLATEMGCSIQQVRKMLDILVEEELIEKIPPTGVERLNHFNTKYVFLWHEWMDGNMRDDAESPLELAEN